MDDSASFDTPGVLGVFGVFLLKNYTIKGTLVHM